VHATSDGRLVVYHDEHAGDLFIPESPFEQVRRFRIGNGEPIPTLEEALDVILALRMIPFVEVKTLDPRFDDTLLDVFGRCRDASACAVHSFDHRIIRRLGRRHAGLKLGILLAAYFIDVATEMKSSCATAVWQRFQFIDRELTNSVRDAGGTVYAWTVDDPPAMQRLLKTGVGGLCTNHPDRARAAIDSLPS